MSTASRWGRLGVVLATFAALPMTANMADAAGITSIDASSLTVQGRITFEGIITGPRDGVLSVGAASFAEKFVGQSVLHPPVPPPWGLHDLLSLGPSGALALDPASSAAENVGVFQTDVDSPASIFGARTLSGLGAYNMIDDNVGEGSIAVLFSRDQFEVGFDLSGTEFVDPGTASISFFRRNGTLIDMIELTELADDPNRYKAGFAFRRDGGVEDIAGFSIYNLDPGGVAIDNIRLTSIPEPGTLALLGLGLAGLAAARRRKQ